MNLISNFNEFIISLNVPFSCENGVYTFKPFPNISFFYNEDFKINDASKVPYIVIDEDIWLHKQEIVKSIIRSKLNLNSIIYARNTVTKVITKSTAQQFLEKNHLLGSASGKYYYGLFYEHTLTAVAVFGRSLLMRNKKLSYELIRYCSKLNIHIAGGLSKIINHFVGAVHPDEIVTFVDKNWFNGSAFEKLGFLKVEEKQPITFYIEKHSLQRSKIKPRKEHYKIKNKGNLKLVCDGFKSNFSKK